MTCSVSIFPTHPRHLKAGLQSACVHVRMCVPVRHYKDSCLFSVACFIPKLAALDSNVGHILYETHMHARRKASMMTPLLSAEVETEWNLKMVPLLPLDNLLMCHLTTNARDVSVNVMIEVHDRRCVPELLKTTLLCLYSCRKAV